MPRVEARERDLLNAGTRRYLAGNRSMREREGVGERGSVREREREGEGEKESERVRKRENERARECMHNIPGCRKL